MVTWLYNRGHARYYYTNVVKGYGTSSHAMFINFRNADFYPLEPSGRGLGLYGHGFSNARYSGGSGWVDVA